MYYGGCPSKVGIFLRLHIIYIKLLLWFILKDFVRDVWLQGIFLKKFVDSRRKEEKDFSGCLEVKM